MKYVRPFFFVAFAVSAAASAAEFRLLTGVDARKYPGVARNVAPSPGPGFPGTFADGDRLAGTSDTGATVAYQGTGTPMYQPNQAGAMSFLFRRGSVPIPPSNHVPLLGIDFLGGPLLDLDGDNGNGSRSLVPVAGNPTPVEIPGSSSHIDMSFNYAGGSASVIALDATGTNEGGPGIQPQIATVLITAAGTTSTGGAGAGPNPTFDTRTGGFTAFTGTSTTLSGVYRITNLPMEMWYDSIDPASSTASSLGSLQQFAKFRGWLIVRDCATGQFPTLTGEGLGSTLWPSVDTSAVGLTYNTAVSLFGPTADIFDGVSGDTFSAAGNGGKALTDGGGDLGAYFDSVVIPHVAGSSQAFIYLESAGFGINNSGDPVFTDTNAYDAVVIGEAGSVFAPGDVDGNGVVEPADGVMLASILLDSSGFSACELARADINADTSRNGADISSFVHLLLP
jgi:hypothetical protein